MGNRHVNNPITGMVAYGDGYRIVVKDVGIFSFSDKPFSGSLAANPLAEPLVSVAAVG